MRSTVAALASVLLCSSDVSGYALGGASSSQRLPHLAARSLRRSDVPVLTSVAAEPLDPAPEDGNDCLVGTGGDGCVGTTGTVPMTINLAKNIAGAGVLSLSAGIASFSGAKVAVLPATLLLLFLGGVSAYSFSLLARVGEDNGTGTIRETWSKLFGERWTLIPDATIIFECMCAATSFAIIIGETFSSVATLCGASAALAAPNAWIVLLSLFVLLPLCLLRDLGSLAFGSILGTSGTIFTAGFMVLRALDGTYAPGGRFFGTLAAASQPKFPNPNPNPNPNQARSPQPASQSLEGQPTRST
jgi:hypothetical protein